MFRALPTFSNRCCSVWHQTCSAGLLGIAWEQQTRHIWLFSPLANVEVLLWVLRFRNGFTFPYCSSGTWGAKTSQHSAECFPSIHSQYPRMDKEQISWRGKWGFFPFHGSGNDKQNCYAHILLLLMNSSQVGEAE